MHPGCSIKMYWRSFSARSAVTSTANSLRGFSSWSRRVGSQPWEFPQVKSGTGPWTQRRRREQRKWQTNPDWQVTVFTSKGTYIRGFSWVAARWVDLCTPHQDLKVSIEALTEFSHMYCPDGLINTLLSQGCVFEMAPTVGRVGGIYIPRTGEQVRSLRLPGSSRSPPTHVQLPGQSFNCETFYHWCFPLPQHPATFQPGPRMRMMQSRALSQPSADMKHKQEVNLCVKLLRFWACLLPQHNNLA